MTFVDTSALLAYLDRDADQHDRVAEELTSLLRAGSGVTHNYVVIEAEALLHRRYGARVARRLLEDVVPLLTVVWMTPTLHARAVAAHLDDLRRRTSLVDHASFTVMRDRGLQRALAIDEHFSAAGFFVAP